MLRLVPFQESFFSAFLQWRAQPLSVRHNPLQPMTTQGLAEMLAGEGSDLSDLRRFESYRWFVEQDGVPVGTVSLKSVSHSMGYAEIGYGIGESYQGNGIATAAVRLLVSKVFTESTLRKLLAYVHDQNIASCRVLQKVGFTQEGFLREHYLINGAPAHELLFGLLKHEWHR